MTTVPSGECQIQLATETGIARGNRATVNRATTRGTPAVGCRLTNRRVHLSHQDNCCERDPQNAPPHALAGEFIVSPDADNLHLAGELDTSLGPVPRAVLPGSSRCIVPVVAQVKDLPDGSDTLRSQNA